MIVPKKELDVIKKDKKESEKLAQKIFNHYRGSGFPHFDLSEDDVRREFRRVKEYDYSNILVNRDVIKQLMHGLSLAWWKFPHAMEIKCGNMRTPMEVFQSDKLFMEVIHKRIRLGDNISDNGIKKMIKMFTGTQCVSNFRPTAAKFIYDKYAGDGNVYDMSCGFGGRLIGAMASEKVKSYVGVEPSTKTYEGLWELDKALRNICGIKKNIGLYKIGSEDFLLDDVKFDLCFTSPPYFDREKYSTEETQSYIKFPTQPEWMHGYLIRTLENCWYMLKDNGYLVINIADVRTYPGLVKDFLYFVKDMYKLIDQYKYALSGMFRYGFKYESIFVFEKIK